jgi:hypothetical protein
MSFWQIIFAAWRGTFGAIRRTPVLFGVVFLALLFVQVLQDYFLPVVHHVHALNSHLPRAPRATPFRAAFGLLEDIITSIIPAPLMLTVHRFVLLGESRGPLSNVRRLALFATYLLGVRLLSEVPLNIEGAVRPDTVSQVVVLILTFAASIVTIRLLLTYPAAALDRAAPLFASWTLTRGHWWYVTFIMICGWLPLMILDAAILYGCYEIRPQLVFGVKLVVGVFLCTATKPLYIASGAALVSELYRKFDLLSEFKPILYRKSNSNRRKFGGLVGGISAFCFYVAGLIFPKSDVANVERVIGIGSSGILLLIGLFLAYGVIKKKLRRA